MIDLSLITVTILIGIIFIISLVYNLYKYKMEFFTTKEKTRSISLCRVSFVLLALLVLANNSNSYILNKNYKSLKSAIESTKPVSKILLVDDENSKLYAETNKDNHTYLVEYKKENKYWKIKNDYLTKTQVITKYKTEDANVKYYISIFPYEINNKLVLYMSCENGVTNDDYCNNVVINDNQKNSFTFKDNKYSYVVLENVNRKDYRYTFDSAEYPL